MSLVGLLSSCEDKFVYDEEQNVVPLQYSAKIYDLDEDTKESTTLQIKGLYGLVFEEIEKTDWKIITPAEFVGKGHEPLKLIKNLVPLTDDGLIFVATNYGNIPLMIANTRVTYNYMGEEIELSPEGGLSLMVKISEDKLFDERPFLQYGNIEFVLMVGGVPVKIHSLKFMVIDENGMNSDLIEDNDENDENNEN